MKFRVYSDIHLEFEEPFVISPDDADAIILAGDTAIGINSVKYANIIKTDKPIILIPGNHEGYGASHSWPTLLDEMRFVANPNVHVCWDSVVMVDGIRILATPLWTGFDYPDGEASRPYNMQRAAMWMNDYVRIGYKSRKLRPEDTLFWHLESREWLAEQLLDTTYPTIVVTHHAPSPQGLGYRGAEIASAYCSDLEPLMLYGSERPPLAWIHGHTHWCGTYQVGDTLVLANSKGYPGQSEPEFSPNGMLEVTTTEAIWHS